MAECILLLESRWEGACKYKFLLWSALEPRAYTHGGQVLYQVNYIPAQSFEFLFIEALEEDGNKS